MINTTQTSLQELVNGKVMYSYKNPSQCMVSNWRNQQQNLFNPQTSTGTHFLTQGRMGDWASDGTLPLCSTVASSICLVQTRWPEIFLSTLLPPVMVCQLLNIHLMLLLSLLVLDATQTNSSEHCVSGQLLMRCHWLGSACVEEFTSDDFSSYLSNICLQMILLFLNERNTSALRENTLSPWPI